MRADKGNFILFSLLILASINFGVIFGYGKAYVWGAEFLFLAMLLLLSGDIEVKIESKFAFVSLVLLTIFLINMIRAGPDAIFSSANFIVNVLVIPFAAYVFGRNLRVDGLIRIFRWIVTILTLVSLGLYFVIESRDYDFPGTLLTGSAFGAMMSLYALIFVVMYINTKNIIDLGLFFTSVLLLVLSEHRTGILALVVSLYVLLGQNFNKGIFRAVARHFVLALIGGFLLVGVFVFHPEIIMNQFYGDEVAIDQIRMSGRLRIWTLLYESWISNLSLFLWGGGLGHATYLIANNFGDTLESIAVPHNEWLRVAIDTGILGVFVIVIYYSKILGLSIGKKFNPIHFALVCHLFVEMFFSNVFFWSGSYVFILVLFSALTHSRPIQIMTLSHPKV